MVTDATTGLPLVGVIVYTYVGSPIDGGSPVEATTDLSGHYQLSGLPGGHFVVCLSLHVVTRYLGSCSPEVTVTEGQVTSNTNLALTAAGQLTGRVTAAQNGQPLHGILVIARGGQWWHESQVTTDATGQYTITQLYPDSYKLYFFAGSDTLFPAYAPQYYQGKSTAGTANLVPVTSGATVSGVDAALQPPGIIRGQLTYDLLNDFSPDATIEVFDAEGNLAGFASIRESGSYAVGGLPFGSYHLRFSAPGHVTRFYGDAPTFESSAVITLASGQVIENIDASLPQASSALTLFTAKDLPNVLFVQQPSTTTLRFSLDGGGSWQAFPTQPWGGNKRALQLTLAKRLDPIVPARFLVANDTPLPNHQPTAEDGLYRSGDNGQSWAKFLPDLAPECSARYGQGFTTLQTSPADSLRLYVESVCYYQETDLPLAATQAYFYSRAATSLPAQPGLAAQPQHLQPVKRQFTSADGGIIWQASPRYNGSSIVLSPVLPQRLYNTNQNGVPVWWQSDDAGQTWLTKTFTVTTLVLDQTDATRLYGVMQAPLPPNNRDLSHYVGSRSADSGDSWTEWGQQPCPTSFQQLISLVVRNGLLMRCAQGLFRSLDGGDTWQQVTTEPGEALFPDYGNPQRVFWSRGGALWVSRDQGGTWSQLATAEQMMSLAAGSRLWLPAIIQR